MWLWWVRISHSGQSSWLIISHCTESVSQSLTPITSRASCDAKTASDISYMHVALRISKSTLTHFIHVNQLSSLVIHVRVWRIYSNIQIFEYIGHEYLFVCINFSFTNAFVRECVRWIFKYIQIFIQFAWWIFISTFIVSLQVYWISPVLDGLSMFIKILKNQFSWR